MRKTLRPAPRTRRSRKRIRLGALIAPSSTIQRSSPLLVTAEIRPTLARRWLGRTTGVSPRGGVAPAAHVVRAQAALVAPEDHSLLRLGPRRDRRVLPAQPAPYCGRVLLVGPPQRLLRSVAPARQVAAHCPHRHSDAEALPDQRLHRCPAPEREVQTQRPASAAGSGPGPPPPALPSADSRVLAPAHAAGFSAPPGHAPQSACKCQRPRSGSARPEPRSPYRSAPPGAAQSPAAVAPLAPPASGSACLRASLFRLFGDSRQIPQEHRSRLNNDATLYAWALWR